MFTYTSLFNENKISFLLLFIEFFYYYATLINSFSLFTYKISRYYLNFLINYKFLF